MRPLRVVFLALFLSGPVGVATAQTVPPPTPVPPNGSPSPYPTALETPRSSTQPPRIEAGSAILTDLDSGAELWARGAGQRRPIASLTKIMTALLVLEAARPDEVVTATENAAAQGGSELGLLPGEEQSVGDLMLALLLQSANDAAVALAEHAAGTVEGFVDGMNRRARRLGLHDTRFASTTGLDDTGYSTASDLAAVTAEAYRDPTFARVVATKFARIAAPDGEPRRLQNRNALLWLYPGSLGGKTGYTAAAGFCLVAAAERDGLRLLTVILGAPAAPWSDAAEVLNYGFATWERRTVVDEDTALDPVVVDGHEVPVHASGALSLLLRVDQAVDLEMRPDPGLELPVVAGERVGALTVSVDDGAAGELPVVADRTVRPEAPAAGDEPWWERAWDAVVGFFTRLFRAIVGD